MTKEVGSLSLRSIWRPERYFRMKKDRKLISSAAWGFNLSITSRFLWAVEFQGCSAGSDPQCRKGRTEEKTSPQKSGGSEQLARSAEPSLNVFYINLFLLQCVPKYKSSTNVILKKLFLVPEVTHVLGAATGMWGKILLAGTPFLWAQAVKEVTGCFTSCSRRNFWVRKGPEPQDSGNTIVN